MNGVSLLCEVEACPPYGEQTNSSNLADLNESQAMIEKSLDNLVQSILRPLFALLIVTTLP